MNQNFRIPIRKPLELNFKTKTLLRWFDSNKKDFPWSKNKSPYLVWISEIMLQQTVAASVIPYFERWSRDYPDVRTLAEAKLSEVLSHWEGLGYYSRCRNLHRAANVIVESFSGKLPDSYKELKALPGIGDYTARAVLSIALKQPFAVLDANVKRIVQRLTATVNWEKGYDKVAIFALENILPVDRPGDFNEAMMQLGQKVCLSSSPRCEICPLADSCLALKKGITGKIPDKIKKKIKKSEKAVLLIKKNEKVLLQKKKRGLFHDLWLLPQVQITDTEDIIWMNLNWSELESVKLKKINHFYTENKDILSPYLFNNPDPDRSQITPENDEDYNYQWVDIDQLHKYPTPSVYRKILNEVF